MELRYEVTLRNKVSDAGYVIMSPGVNHGQVNFVLDGGNKDRRDFRLDIDELHKAVAIIEAGIQGKNHVHGECK